MHVEGEVFKRLMKTLKDDTNSRLLSTTLRFHLLIEYYIDRILIENMKGGYKLIDSNFSFSQKILLVDSLQVLNDSVLISIKNLNKLRNKCAHDIDYSICEKDIEIIGRPFGKDYMEFAKRYLGRDLKTDKDPHFLDAFLLNTYVLLLKKLTEFVEIKKDE